MTAINCSGIHATVFSSAVTSVSSVYIDHNGVRSGAVG
jgi:hypothetical protein